MSCIAWRQSEASKTAASPLTSLRTAAQRLADQRVIVDHKNLHKMRLCGSTRENLGTFGLRGLSKIAHFELAVPMPLIRNRAGGMTAPGPTLPTRALQQVGHYPGYTGRDANIVAEAALAE